MVHLAATTASVVLLFLNIQLAAASTCPPGYYRHRSNACYQCVPGCEEEGCPKSCFCTDDASCGGNKLHFCNREYRSGKTANVCRQCFGMSSNCEVPAAATAESTPVNTSRLVQNNKVYGKCSASCGCTTHSQCPSGNYCGSLKGYGSGSAGTNLCRPTRFCTDDVAVDGSCPPECQSQDDCVINQTASESAFYCTRRNKCAYCQPPARCYTPPALRNYSSFYRTEEMIDGWCPRTCCGYVTAEGTSKTTYKQGNRTYISYWGNDDIVFNLCGAERFTHNGFSVVTAHTATLVETIAAGQPSELPCSITVDIAPDTNHYPRQVPLVRCNATHLPCRKTVNLVLFGTEASTGATTKLVNLELTAGGSWLPWCSDTTAPTTSPTGAPSSVSVSVQTVVIGVAVAGCVATAAAVGVCLCRRVKRESPAEPHSVADKKSAEHEDGVDSIECNPIEESPQVFIERATE